MGTWGPEHIGHLSNGLTKLIWENTIRKTVDGTLISLMTCESDQYSEIIVICISKSTVQKVQNVKIEKNHNFKNID